MSDTNILTCCICYDEEGEENLVKSPNCQCKEAIYHRRCVEEYIEKRPLSYEGPGCPICRVKFTTRERVKYHWNLSILYVYLLIIFLSILMEILLPSSSIEFFFFQIGFMFLLVTVLYYKEIMESVFEFIGVES